MNDVQFKPNLSWLHERIDMISDFDPENMSEWAVKFRRNLCRKLHKRAIIADIENMPMRGR